MVATHLTLALDAHVQAAHATPCAILDTIGQLHHHNRLIVRLAIGRHLGVSVVRGKVCGAPSI